MEGQDFPDLPTEGLFPLPPERHESDFQDVERAEHIVAALDAYDREATLMALIRKFNTPKWHEEQKAKFGAPVTYKWMRQTHEKHQMAVDEAKAEFYAANPIGELDEAELIRRYEKFQADYRGTSPGRIEKRQKARETNLQFIGYNETPEELAQEEQGANSKDDITIENPDAKVSLARALRPDFNHLDPADYEDIDDGIFKQLTPDFFRRTLINVRPRTRNARWHIGESGKPEYIVLVPGEWSTVLRSDPQYLADAAFNKSEDTQHKLPDDERDTDAPQQARIGSSRRQARAMRDHVQNDLEVSLAVLAKFSEAAQYSGGLARFGNEANMRDQLEHFWYGIIGDMVWATRIVRGWTPEQEKYVFRALVKGVHFAPDHKTRLHRRDALADAAEEWLRGRRDHMIAQSLKADQYANEQEEIRNHAAVNVSKTLF